MKDYFFTKYEDINGNQVCSGDIVEFNPIGSTGVKSGVIVIKWPASANGHRGIQWGIEVGPEPITGTVNVYDFPEQVFGKVKVIKNI